jgi:hypothetical protein
MSPISDLTSPGLSSQGLSSKKASPAILRKLPDEDKSDDDKQKSNHKGLKDDEDDADDSEYEGDESKKDKNDDLRYDSEPADYSDKEDGQEDNEDIGIIPPNLSTAERERSLLKSSTVRGDERKRKLSSVSSSSRGSTWTYEKRMHQLSSKKYKIQDTKTSFPFTKGTPEQNSTGFMKCIPCGKEVTFKVLSTILKHLDGDKHRRCLDDHTKSVVPLQVHMRRFLSDKVTEQEKQGVGSKKSLTATELRMQLCYALLSDGLPFKFLDNKNPRGLATFLRLHAGVDVSGRKIRDMIPDVLNLENENIASDLQKAKYMSVIFDATPDRGEAFGVVVRYVNDLYEVEHKCICLKFYESTFDSKELGMSIPRLCIINLLRLSYA